MSDRINLLDLPMTARGPGHIVGWRAGVAVSQQMFLARVERWRALLMPAPGRDFALYLDDGIEFASALLGAWHAGKTVVLPADTSPATCAALSVSVDGYLGDFPVRWHPLAAPRDDTGGPAPVARLGPLPADLTALMLFSSEGAGAARWIPKKLCQLAAEVATLEAVFGPLAGAADVVATVSHQHLYGLLFKVLWPLTAGRALHAASMAMPDALRQVAHGRDWILVASPMHLPRLPQEHAWCPGETRLKGIFSSGGPLPWGAAQTCLRLFQQVPIEIYGGPVTGSIAWRRRQAPSAKSWKAMPGVQWHMERHTGALKVRSVHLPDSAWVVLADRVAPASAGRFVLQGRLAPIVKSGDERCVELDAIELGPGAPATAARPAQCGAPGQCGAVLVVPSPPGRIGLAEGGKAARASAPSATALPAPPRQRHLPALLQPKRDA